MIFPEILISPIERICQSTWTSLSWTGLETVPYHHFFQFWCFVILFDLWLWLCSEMFAVVSARRGPTILMPRTVMRVEPNATLADLFERASQSSAWTFAGSVDDVVGVRLHSMAITHRVSDGHGRPVDEHGITGHAYIGGSGDGIQGNWIQIGWRFWAVTWHNYLHWRCQVELEVHSILTFVWFWFFVIRCIQLWLFLLFIFPNFCVLNKKCTIILGHGPYINSVLLAHLTARLIS